MKIAIIGTRGLPARYGGFETLAARLGSGLAKDGHEVTVYGRTGYGQPARASIAPHLRAVRMPCLSWRGAETISAGWAAALQAGLMARPDVALVCNPANVWSARALQMLGIPVLLHLDGLEHARAKWQGAGSRVHAAAMRSAARSPLRLLTDSQAIARWYQENLAASPAVIAYGCAAPTADAARLQAQGLQPRGYDLIVARMEPENHVLEMVRAHARSGSEVPLVLVGAARGNTEYARRVEAAAAAHPRLLRLGAVWDDALLDALWAGARCYLHGHSVGGTNPALLSGAASGAEVLAHRNPFNAEVLGEQGWQWGDADELTALLQEKPWQSTPKTAALAARTQARYRWPQVVAAYEALFAELAPSASH
ncbi:MAG: glycosyltransferase [Candidatus Nanopelagicales bacterium]